MNIHRSKRRATDSKLPRVGFVLAGQCSKPLSICSPCFASCLGRSRTSIPKFVASYVFALKSIFVDFTRTQFYYFWSMKQEIKVSVDAVVFGYEQETGVS